MNSVEDIINFFEDNHIFIETDELITALLFIKMCKETNSDLHAFYGIAIMKLDMYKKGYDDGFEAGIQEARDRIVKAFKEGD